MNLKHQPPKPAEKLLRLMLTNENMEAILGDLFELFVTYQDQSGINKAYIWYWNQVFRSAPALLQLKLSGRFERSFISMDLKLHNKTYLSISLVMLLPALFLVIPGILQSGFGYFGANDARDALISAVPAMNLLLNPVILMGGLILAFILNVLPAMTFQLERKPEGLTSAITFKPVYLHWVFIGASFLMVGIILVYAFFENIAPAFH